MLPLNVLATAYTTLSSAPLLARSVVQLVVAATIPNLLPGGHCFMSTLRLKENVSNFRRLVDPRNKTVKLPEDMDGEAASDSYGLGVQLDMQQLARLTTDSISVSQRK